jgi:hypothetical protein
MSIEMWIAFVIAALLVLVVPGPTILLVISQALARGRGAVFPLVAGVTLGDFTAMTLSLVGLGAVLTGCFINPDVIKSSIRWKPTCHEAPRSPALARVKISGQRAITRTPCRYYSFEIVTSVGFA